ncbi:hypothetical protein ACFWP5_00010 [Streptomyces sp. NPDC058469]|uniref:hypothetical protein n=1 Tax=Streptomyces sp. NPDC058469 TaxID=3346514 RepID=UPI003666616C
MATPRSAGRTLAVPERTGRTTHDRDPATTDGSAGSAGFRTTGHGRPDQAGADDLDVPHTPLVPDVPDTSRAKKPNAPHAKNTLPHDNGIPCADLGSTGLPALALVA